MTAKCESTTAPRVVTASGEVLIDGVESWLGEPRSEERAVLARAVAPVLDVGCGPGRHVLELAARGVVALGVDAAPSAVRVARDRGAPVLRRSIFDPLPGAGRWGTTLLLDGNIGIGGDPGALLRRLAKLMRRGGLVLIEIEGPGVGVYPITARIEAGSQVSPWFPWARVGMSGLAGLAAVCDYRVEETWRGGDRWFASLRLRSSRG
jgi:SAM-dependent methyltransferase